VPSTSVGSRAKQLLLATRGHALTRTERAARASELAGLLLALSQEHTRPDDRARARMLGRLMDDARGQQLTNALTDRLYRSRDPERVLDQVGYVLKRYGVPRYMRAHERAALLAVRGLSALPVPLASGAVAAAVVARVRGEARSVLLDADERALARHIGERHREGVRVNVNQLGEALLGEREAEQRVAKYVALAERPNIDALSVKVSSIGSQLNLLAFESTVEVLRERLRRIYAATLSVGRERERTLVMLDMEAYAHVELTLAVLFRTLDDPALDRVRAGVVLQAYLPDASALLSRVQAYASARVARGGAPLRVRLVKGANLAHERVESAKSGLSVPIFGSKREVDAHYKVLLERALRKDSIRSLAIGVASHNLFDLAYALLLRAEGELDDGVELELLEGMAEPVRRALSAVGASVLVYAPVCKDDELNNGIAYLVRRLDENTAQENYLRSSFDLKLGGAAFERERERFTASLTTIDQLDLSARRSHDAGFDRRHAREGVRRVDFCGEADTDFTQAQNRDWVRAELARALDAPPPLVHSLVAALGRDDRAARSIDGVDPSRPGVVPYHIELAGPDVIERALACAAADPTQFSRTSVEERAHLMLRAAAALREARGALIAAMVCDGGKRVVEADVEVSEAVDFAEYYRSSFAQLVREQRVDVVPRGVVLVTPPWNFPLAIAAGGVLAALMAGCRVLFKPALETALVGFRLATLLHDAGVPREVLQLLTCEDEVASALVRDARVDSVILTGATATARLFHKLRPGLRLLAETGGKNAYVVSAMSDRELAIRDVVLSAFGHAGQKCSAASLLILEDEVYDDPHFRTTLRDAVESQHVGSAWAAESVVTPLIREPEEALSRALTTLEPGETWLVEPRFSATNPRLVSPGVKLGVRAGSFTHGTELFGPVLGVMRARSVAHAVELANATGYGLTAGLASLDEREQAFFSEHMRAGNLYINRTITGAIVERQPFGGIGKSGFGPGAKAGGPNYVAQLVHVMPRATRRSGADDVEVSWPAVLDARFTALARLLDEADVARVRSWLSDYVQAWQQHFSREHDPSAVHGQFNHFRYRPADGVVVRVEADAAPIDIVVSCLGAELVGARIAMSVDPRARAYQDTALFGFAMRIESTTDLLHHARPAARLRLLGARNELHDQYAAAVGAHIADEPVLPLGRFELLHYLSEQSISVEHHRYGHVQAAQP
jgi:RHH-type proline utilization regulon transcriptional repressor/proline dehydrogenase/delta 1-pyrroline-5-carboxylate dehydrogenase